MRNELWKPVKGNMNYEVSDLGRVRRCTGKLMTLMLGHDRRWQVRLFKNGRARAVPVAQLVAEAFLGASRNGSKIEMKDSNPRNAAAANLLLVREQERVSYPRGTAA